MANSTFRSFLLRNLVMCCSERSNLWKVSNADNLSIIVTHFLHDLSHHFSDFSTYTRVNFIKDNCRQFYRPTYHSLQRQHYSSYFPTTGHLTYRLHWCARVGREQKVYLVDAIA